MKITPGRDRYTHEFIVADHHQFAAGRRRHVAVQQPAAQAAQGEVRLRATDAWLDHVQKSSVRFNSGGSGSFVSADGLVMSNHHVGADCLQKLSDAEHNYYRDGFHARTLRRGEAVPSIWS